MIRFRRLNFVLGLCLCIVLYLLAMTDEDGLDFSWIIAPKITPQSVEIQCYENVSRNTLEEISNSNVKRNTSIFFVETRCHTDSINLNPRQACAVESAARLNPGAEIYLLIPSPVNNRREFITEHVKQLYAYNNVRIRHVDMNKYFVGTPLEFWYKEGRLKSSKWPQSHASDILRYTTLWKFGGIYVDLDVVLIKSFEGMSNFAGAESKEDVAAGFLSFDHGHEMATLALYDLLYHFRGYDWGYNGPGVITRVLKKVCNTKKVEQMTPERCRGFTVHKPSAFYPIPWRKWKEYFNETHPDQVMEKLNQSYAIHVWNKFSRTANISVGSQAPYCVIASRFCPKVFATVQSIF